MEMTGIEWKGLHDATLVQLSAEWAFGLVRRPRAA